MLALWRFPYKHLRPFALVLLVASLALLILVFVPGLGIHLKGATSWLAVGPISFQPAELLKLTLVIYLAAWLGDRHERVKNWHLGLLPFAIVVSFIGLLLLLQ